MPGASGSDASLRLGAVATFSISVRTVGKLGCARRDRELAISNVLIGSAARHATSTDREKRAEQTLLSLASMLFIDRFGLWVCKFPGYEPTTLRWRYGLSSVNMILFSRTQQDGNARLTFNCAINRSHSLPGRGRSQRAGRSLLYVCRR